MEDWDFFDEHELQAGRVAYTSSYASAHARFSRWYASMFCRMFYTGADGDAAESRAISNSLL